MRTFWRLNEEDTTKQTTIQSTIDYVSNYVPLDKLGIEEENIEYFRDCLNALEEIVDGEAVNIGMGEVERLCYDAFLQLEDIDKDSLEDRVRYILVVCDMILNANPWGLDINAVDENCVKVLKMFKEGCPNE